MGQLAAALDPLDEATAHRVLRWASDRYGATVAQKPSQEPGSNEGMAQPEPSDIHELFGLARRLRSDQERALLAAYWFQHHEAADAVTGQQLNDELKQMGFGAANITHVLTRLMNQ